MHGCAWLTDDGLAHLRGNTTLTALDLYNCMRITGTGLAHLRGIPLSRLNLARCEKLSDEGLAALQGVSTLTSLNLWGVELAEEWGFRNVAGAAVGEFAGGE